MIIGIDATNIRSGGGVTHLVELLRAADPTQVGVEQVVIWGGKSTLSQIDDRSWLKKITPKALDKNLLIRTIWQCFSLSKAATLSGCDILFIPGGSYAGKFRPFVSMSQNMLPFEWRELLRYGWSIPTLKLMFLRYSQSTSFSKADGVIFLTDYAKHQVFNVTGTLKNKTETVSHGLCKRFFMAPRPQYPISDYNIDKPYRILYVSIIDQYKHQWHLIKSVSQIRDSTGWPLVLDLVGPAYLPALKRLNSALDLYDPNRLWVNYHGSIPYQELHGIYASADLGVFASSCENMPNILLETMAAGLPIACSKLGPMYEMLGETGIYFHPEQPTEISASIRRLVESPDLRTELSNESFAKAGQYTWQRCANQTFTFLVKVYTSYRKHI